MVVSRYQRQFMALGPTQPPVQWVPKTIYGPGAHSAPNSVGTKDNLWPWGPPSPQFSGYWRQFMALGPTQPPIQCVSKTVYGPGVHPAPNSVGTEDNLWPWGPPSPQLSRYQRQIMALGPTQPPIQWVSKTIYGPGAHSAPNSVCTKEFMALGPTQPPFSVGTKEFMALRPTQHPIQWVPNNSWPWGPLSPQFSG